MYKIPNTDLIAMDESEYLEHFGVTGMKWGHRKTPTVRNGISKADLKSAKSTMKRDYWTQSMDPGRYNDSSSKYYNLKRKYKGKKTKSYNAAASIQEMKNMGAVFLKVYGASYLALKTIKILSSSPEQKQALKVGASFLAAKGSALAGQGLGTAAGKTVKFARSASGSGAIYKAASAVRRAKKYGKYVNTTGFSVPSASRMIGR